MTSFVVAKFGGTSVADYDAMNRSADVVLADPNTRLGGTFRLSRRDEPAGFSV